MKILYLCTLSCLIYLECCSCRKDLKFVSDVEKEMRMLVEAVNKVSIWIFCMTHYKKQFCLVSGEFGVTEL